MTREAVLPELDAATYQRHALHSEERAWVEKNCYVDVWIELVHALGLDPMAMLPFSVAVDFLDDQWTFFKPPHGELDDLYGIDVQELNVWRPLLEHAVRHLGARRLVATEADAFWLPDTSGTDYRTQHTKTTIILGEIDVEQRALGYFHNAAYHRLAGEDFTNLFRVGAPVEPTFMPMFAEVISIDRLVKRPTPQLRDRSRALLERHLRRRPTDNPFGRFGARFAADFPTLQREGLGYYHAWAFANVRQIGAAFELAALYVRWLADPALESAAQAFDEISTHAKTFILKGARAVNAAAKEADTPGGRRRSLDAAPLFEGMAGAWSRAMETLTREMRIEAP